MTVAASVSTGRLHWFNWGKLVYILSYRWWLLYTPKWC